MKLTKTQLKQIIKEEISNVLEIGMFHDPIGYKKSEPSKSPYTKEYQKDGTYVIYKNGKVVKSGIEGEGNANAWINNQQRKELNLEVSQTTEKAKDKSDIKGTEAYKRAEWQGRYGSMKGFDKAYPQYSKKDTE